MYTHVSPTPAFESDLLKRLASSWSNRVAVRRDRLDLDQYYDPTIPDFPIEMVPFWNDPEFQSVTDVDKYKVLACAWISYNEKTIYIEDKVINPLCALLLANGLPGVDSSETKQVLAQTLVDEQFHILMCLEVCDCARKRHKLENFEVAEPLLGLRVNQALAKAEDEQHAALIRMAYGTVAEMTINAFLKQLSEDKSIQPVNRLNTDLHRRDEASHAAIFGEVARGVYQALPESDQHRLKRCIVQALNDFVELDLGFWRAILDHLAIPGRESILQRLEESSASKRAPRDYTLFIRLLDELGIKEETHFLFE